MIKNEILALKLKFQSLYAKSCDKRISDFEDAFLALVDAYGYGFAFSKALDIIEIDIGDFLDE